MIPLSRAAKSLLHPVLLQVQALEVPLRDCPQLMAVFNQQALPPMFTWKIRGKIPNSKPHKEEDGLILFEHIAPCTTPGKQNIPMLRGWAEPPSAAQSLGCCHLVSCGSWLNFGALKPSLAIIAPAQPSPGANTRSSISGGDTKAALGTRALQDSPTGDLFTHR